MEGSGNFFTEELSRYYSEQGKNLSEQVIRVLNKSVSELSGEDKEAFEKYVLPAHENIKQALITRLNQPEASEEEWREELLFHSQTIIGQIVTEIFSEPKVADIPDPVIAQEASEGSKDFRSSELSAVQASKEKSRNKYKKSLIIGLLVVLGVAIVVVTLYLTVFMNKDVLSFEGFKVKLPEGYSAETSKLDEVCGIVENSIYLHPSSYEDMYADIYINYPSPNPVCFSNKYFNDYPYHEDTNIGGKRVLAYGGIEDDSDLVVYMVEDQVWISGTAKYKDVMFKIVDSASCDFKTYEVPEPLQGGYEELIGTWANKDDQNYIIRLYPDYHQEAFYCSAEGTGHIFWGQADGRTFESGEGVAGGHDAIIYIQGDGSELYCAITTYADYSGNYRLLYRDPFWVEGSPSPSEISWDDEPQLPENDYAISATRSFMDSIVSKDLEGLSNHFNTYYFEGGEESYFAALNVKRYKIAGYQASGDYITVTVQYESEMGTVHNLQLVWETFSTASKTPYLYDWILDPKTSELSNQSSPASREEYIANMDALIAELAALENQIKATAVEINNNIDAVNQTMKQDMMPECDSLKQSLDSLKDKANSWTPPAQFEQVHSQLLQLVDYCLQRVDTLYAGIQAVESGGDYVSAFNQGVAPKQAYEALLPTFQTQYNSLKNQ